MLIGVTILAGLTIRFVPMGLPASVVKYGGSLLWALMIYWIVSALRPHWSLPRNAVASGAIALSVESFKLVHAPALDAFRLTLPGMLLLGRVFTPGSLVAYACAIVVGAALDRAIRGRHTCGAC